MEKSTGIATVIILVIVGVVMSLAFVIPSNIYSGKVMFESEADYSIFKEVIAQDSVHYESKDISVLSSEPPIVVQFRVKAPDGFPYGQRDWVNSDFISIGAFMLVCVGLLGAAQFAEKI